MEVITIDLKEKILALYWGQRVASSEMIDLLKRKDLPNVALRDTDYINLNSLSSLTDEDALEIAKIFRWNHYSDYSKIHQVKDFISNNLNYHSTNISAKEYFELIDYLRSKSYAVPAFGYDVDQLIEAGIFKINENC